MLLSVKRRVHQYLLRDPAFRFLFDEPPPGEAVAIDCETTGLNTRKDDIVTIAAIRIRGSRILASERFESMVKPNARMKAEAIKVHHLREGDVAGGRTMEQVLPELLRWHRQLESAMRARTTPLGFSSAQIATPVLEMSRQRVKARSRVVRRSSAVAFSG